MFIGSYPYVFEYVQFGVGEKNKRLRIKVWFCKWCASKRTTYRLQELAAKLTLRLYRDATIQFPSVTTKLRSEISSMLCWSRTSQSSLIVVLIISRILLADTCSMIS